MKFKLPKKILNALLFYSGCCGLLMQLLGVVFFWWHQLSHPAIFWWTWPAPLICVLWGIVPSLQLQKEHIAVSIRMKA